MIVEFTPEARQDLVRIGEWIARDDPARAASFVDELIDRAEMLADAFGRYPAVDQRAYPGVRRMNHRRYRIFYRVEQGRVEILHIHHGARGTPDFV